MWPIYIINQIIAYRNEICRYLNKHLHTFYYGFFIYTSLKLETGFSESIIFLHPSPAFSPLSLQGQTDELPFVSDNWDPPAFDLAQLSIRHIDLQREFGNPDGELQLSRQVQVGEVDCQGLPTTHFFTVHQDLVAVWGHLRSRERTRG